MSNCVVWKPVVGCEDCYEVSSDGKIRSLKREHSKGGIMKTSKHNVTGYEMVMLCCHGERLTRLVHRLVAIAFIPNPENKRTVNHKNEIKTDNRVENLEWMTHEENTNYGSANKKRAYTLSLSKRKPVMQIKDGKVINVFKSTVDASNKTRVDEAAISACCLGKRKTAGKSQWKYF